MPSLRFRIVDSNNDVVPSHTVPVELSAGGALLARPGGGGRCMRVIPGIGDLPKNRPIFAGDLLKYKDEPIYVLVWKRDTCEFVLRGLDSQLELGGSALWTRLNAGVDLQGYLRPNDEEWCLRYGAFPPAV